MSAAVSLVDTAASWKESAGRVVITGWPRAGKTTLAQRLEAIGIQVEHTDFLIASHRWSEASAEVALRMRERGPWCFEGVTALRAIRKAALAHPGRPCDLLVWCGTPKVELSPGQRSMGRGQDTILAGIRADLVGRGVEIMVLS